MTLRAELVTNLPQAPERVADSHKGTFGRALVIGGSCGMSGAAALAGVAALRGGAGLVAVATPMSVTGAVAAFEPSCLTVPLPEDRDGRICLDAETILRREVAASTAVAIGPGLGRSNDLRALVRRLYESVDRPLVLDADALNAMASIGFAGPRRRAGCKAPRGPRILTPHPGEFSRMTGLATNEVQSRRETLAVEFAAANGVVLVLKGNRSIVTDGARIAINTTGNSGMATGGTGDVLTGLVVSLAAQRMPAFAAAQLAVHLHGLAGDLAADELSQPALIASDLVRFLGPAWRKILAASPPVPSSPAHPPHPA